MKYEKYTDKNGVEKEVAKVNARDLLMLGGNKQAAQSTKPAVALDEPDDDLPF
jgi:single-stranded DNA-binding protein